MAKYRVVSPIVAPIAASAGMLLTVWPRSETHTLAVCRDAPGFPVVRHCFVAPGALYGIVLNWEADGVIAPLSAETSLRRLA